MGLGEAPERNPGGPCAVTEVSELPPASPGNCSPAVMGARCCVSQLLLQPPHPPLRRALLARTRAIRSINTPSGLANYVSF